MTLGSGDQVGTDLPGTLSSKEKVKRIEIGKKAWIRARSRYLFNFQGYSQFNEFFSRSPFKVSLNA